MGSEDVTRNVVEFAAQTGRLDFVSVLLAMIAILLAVLAFPVFYYIQRRAEAVARAEANEVLAELTKRIESDTISKFDAMLPRLFEVYSEMARQAATDDVSNRIAAAQDNGGE